MLISCEQAQSRRAKPKKKAMVRGTKEMLAKAFYLSFQAAISDWKEHFFTFLRFLQWIWSTKRTMNTILVKSVDWLYHSELTMNSLGEKLYRHPALTQNPAESMGRTTDRKIKDGVVKNDEELINPLSSDIVSSWKVSDDSSVARGGPCPGSKKKLKKHSPRRKELEIEKDAASPLISHRFRQRELEFTTSQDNPSSRSSDRDHGRTLRTRHIGDGL